MTEAPPKLPNPPTLLINGPHYCRWCGDTKTALNDAFICMHCDRNLCTRSHCETCATMNDPTFEGLLP